MPRKLQIPRKRLSYWSDEFTGDLTVAQARFLKRYGFRHDDKQRVHKVILDLLELYGRKHDDKSRLDDVISELLKNDESATASPLIEQETVPIPAVLVLALTLQKGFGRGRGRAHRSRETARRIANAVHMAQKLLPKYLKQSHRQRFDRPAAMERAAAEAEQLIGVPAHVILAKDNWQSRQRRSRAKRPS